MGQIVQLAPFKFGEYELDPARFELRRNGNPVKLERIPLELLILLVEKDGAVVSRQEIVERLWGKDVFLDTEHGINTAIRKIRTALREDAEKPRFVQTVSGKGYRFVGEVANGAAAAVSGEVVAAAARIVEPPAAAPAASKWRPPWRLAVTAVVVLAVAGAALLVWYQRREKAGNGKMGAIAVLPLANLSGDASQDYLADGLTDELITMLAKNTRLHVVSRTSAMQFKGARRPLREVARELGADCILEGSISRAQDRVHMTVQVIRAADDSHVWAESYERDAKSVFELPAEIAASVGRKLGAAEVEKRPQRYVNPEAHDAYLRGRYLWYSENQQRAMEYFQQAAQLQPDYAAAWSGIADVYTVQAVGGTVSPREVRTYSANAARKAVELDDSLAEAHHSLAAYYLFLEWNWKLAEAESQRALELNPQLAEGYHLRSYIMFAMNRPEEALKAQLRSTELDPFARSWALGRAYIMLRQYDAAIKELQLREDAHPPEAWPHFFLMQAYMLKGMEKEWVSELKEGLRQGKQKEALQGVEQAYRKGGSKGIQRWFLDTDLAASKKRYFSPRELARDYAILGRKEEALAMLESAFRERTPQLIFIQYTPEFDFLHDDPRYRKIVQDMNMNPAY